MQDVLTMLSQLRRPRLLMRAARIGAEDYRRTVHLPRLLGHSILPRHGATLMRLIELEDALNDQRLNEDAAYSLLKHIDLLIAIVGEARTMKSAQTQQIA